MKITRQAALRRRGITITEDLNPTMSVLDSGLNIQFWPIVESHSVSKGTNSTYTVEISREDLLRMVGILFDESVESVGDI